MNINKEKIKLKAEKVQHSATSIYLISKEKANSLFSKIKVFVHNAKVWIENKWNERDFSFLRGIHFNVHHLTTVCTVGLLAFFVTLYATSANTGDLNAFDKSATTEATFSEKAIEVSYGDHKALGDIAKDVLGNKISVVNQPKLLVSTSNSCVYVLGEYVSEITILGEKKLGNTQAQIRIEKEETYNDKKNQSVEIYSDDKNAVIEKGMELVYTVDLNVIDTEAPKINLESTEITLDEKDSFDTSKYLVNIVDNFDGMVSNYTVEGEVEKEDDKLVVGDYIITYRSVDSSKNEAAAVLKVKVNKVEEEKEKVKATDNYSLQADSPYAGSIVSEARRLIGSAYIYGSNGPNAFDCSGFVQYVYSRAGMGIPRTSGAQSHFGNAINPNDMSQWRAGDIITFGVGGNEHAAIYSGAGTLIHALNPSQGVLETGVFGNVYAVRRP